MTDKPTTDGLSALTRRTMLAVTAGGTATGLATIALGQNGNGPDIKLGGKIEAWIGQLPQSIEGAQNPTLQLESGRTYELVWENLDGLEHELIIEDANGNELAATESVSEQGATASVTFEATEEMTHYYCEYHPQSMEGDVQVEAPQTTETTTTTDKGPKRYFPKGPTVGVEVVGKGLTAPIDMAVAPGVSDRRFVADQTGQVYVHGPDGFRDEPFVDVSDRIIIQTDGYDERGLLGIEFHPSFESNRTFYLHYSVPPREGTPPNFDHTEVIAEFVAQGGIGTGAAPERSCVLMEIPSPQANHNAGPMAFGPDGYLYIPMGDGGGANDTGLGHVSDWYEENDGGNGQDVEQNLLGGIIRVDVDDPVGGEPYAIPEDNPLVNRKGLDEMYAWGFRNPFGISFDSDGRLFVADAGQHLFEEINIVKKGGNYGWNVKEATHCFNAANAEQPLDQCPDSTPSDIHDGEPLQDPIVEYPHTYEGEPVGIVVVGGHRYEQGSIPALTGHYVFGEYTKTHGSPTGRLLAATPPEMETPPEGSPQQTIPNAPVWYTKELQVAGNESGRLAYYNRGMGSAGGETYIFGSKRNIPAGDTGVLLKLVQP